MCQPDESDETEDRFMRNYSISLAHYLSAIRYNLVRRFQCKGRESHIYSNEQLGMRVYMKLVMIVGLRVISLCHVQKSNCQGFKIPVSQHS